MFVHHGYKKKQVTICMTFSFTVVIFTKTPMRQVFVSVLTTAKTAISAKTEPRVS